MSISIVSCCMNRNANLAKAVPSWLRVRGVERIVIVDWHSEERVQFTLSDCLDNSHPEWKTRVHIIRVELPESKRKWVLSWAYNFGVQFVHSDFVLKLDADNVLHPDFLEQTLKGYDLNNLWFKHYWRGDWRSAKTRQQVYLNGVLLVSKSAFVAVGGYSEYLTKYGWEDSAIHQSLEQTLGLSAVSLDPAFIQHLPHSDEQRVGKGRNTFRDIHFNRFLHERLGWLFASQPRCVFEPVEAEHDTLYHCRLVSHPTVEPEHLLDAERKLNEFISFKMLTPPEPRRPPVNPGTGSSNPPTTTPHPNPGKGMIYVLVRNGLGNKMRALASAYTLFDGLNKSLEYNPYGHGYHLIIVWSQDHHCQASMSDLFDISSVGGQDYPSQISIVKHLPAVLGTPLLELTDSNLWDEYKSADTSVMDNIQNLLSAIRSKAQAQEPINVLLESASVIESPFRSWTNECKFIRGLRLSTVCQERVDQNEQRILRLTGLGSMHEMVSVHVRKGQDGSSYDDVSKWSEAKRLQWRTWRSLSTPETFVCEMLTMMDKHPGLKFVVCSDSADTFKEMEKSFPAGTIFEQERKDGFDRSVEQVQSALVDIILISKTRVLLGSQWSSFTELSRRWSDVELRLAGMAF